MSSSRDARVVIHLNNESEMLQNVKMLQMMLML
jgi:hypothetical protein